jgi:hypothetical protein
VIVGTIALISRAAALPDRASGKALIDSVLFSDRKARSTAAAGGGIGILDLERRAAEILDIIDLSAAYEIKADRIDDQGHTVALDGQIVGFDRIGQTETILEARTAATIDRKPQNGGLALTLRDRRDARGGGYGQVHMGSFGHVREIGRVIATGKV